jgi:S-DNA-T family DNA segregation ATPase FtsK/SpoIIIE
MQQRHRDVLGLGLVAIGVFAAFPLYLGWDGGPAGAAMIDALAYGFGALRYAAPVAIVLAGAWLVLRPSIARAEPIRAGLICLLGSVSLAYAAGTFGLGPEGVRHGFFDKGFMYDRGGYLGDGLLYGASSAIGNIGAHTLAIFLFLAALVLLTGASLAAILTATGNSVAGATRVITTSAPSMREPRITRRPKRVVVLEPEDDELLQVSAPDDFGPELPAEFEPEPEPEMEEQLELAPPPAADDDIEDERPSAFVASGDDIVYRLPNPGSLKKSTGDQARPDTTGIKQTGERLIEALDHFNVAAQIVGTVSGPHITRFELRLAPGIKMSKVAQLKDDLAYALAATEIRILAPIPGKRAVGVEVPNANRRLVHLGDVYGKAPAGSSPLHVWLGKDVSGKAVGADLAKMPHLLVAGTTGAGKSACINSLLSSILLGSTPDDVRLVLIDPKQVELNHYDAVPHLLTPVITSPRKAANALQNLVGEMEWRYGVMSMKRTRSLAELNRARVQEGDKPLPYILCVIDELADLMMVAPADVEDAIIRIAQKARAVGIHLVLATQSPRVDVITGMIKANVPSRVAFAVSSQTDSRVILDQNGAESLLGMGDMLFSPVGASKLERIQGAYIDEPQIETITEFWARQGEPELREELLDEVEAEEPEKTHDGEFDPDEDPLLGEAIQLVVEMGTASTSMLQRRLRLGYTRAGRLVDMLERRGIVSGYEGSKPRQVLVTASDLPRVLDALAGGSSEDAVPSSPAADEPA